jgi:hypothetical protein
VPTQGPDRHAMTIGAIARRTRTERVSTVAVPDAWVLSGVC